MPRTVRRYVRAILDGTIEEGDGVPLATLWYEALRAGLAAAPPYSAAYVKLIAEIGHAAEMEKGGRGRGVTIILPKGGMYDPMAREGKTGPGALGAAEPKPQAADPAALDDVLGTGDERLEMVDDVPSQCPDCRGRGWRVVGGAARERVACRLCEGRGVLG